MTRKKQPRGVGAFRTPHGTAKQSGADIVFECVPDGLRPADPALAAPIERSTGGQFTAAGAATAARRKAELGKVPDAFKGELALVPFAGFEPFDTGRRGLLAAKSAEIVEATGQADTGTMAVLRGWSWLTAFAEYYAHQAATTGDPDAATKARQFFKDASIELAKSWEFARVRVGTRNHRTMADEIEAAGYVK
jgi:hypothetical protein